MPSELPFLRPPPEPDPERTPAPRDEALRTVRLYHRASSHHPRAFAPGPGELDWASQPDPFRRYAGAPLLPLEHVPLERSPGYDAALLEGGVPPEPVALRSVSRLFEDALAVTAWKEYGAARWALRANPSSGNLHPTEAYLLAGPVPGLSAEPLLAHYAPREHALEVRRTIPRALWEELRGGLPAEAFFVGLTSIHWREAWKYGERAWRYCQHDLGHALGGVAIAAAGLGWRARLADDLGFEDLERLLATGTAGAPGAAEPEEADLLLALAPAELDAAALPRASSGRFAELETRGRPNVLSPEHVDWPAIEPVSRAARKPRTADAWSAPRAALPRPPGAWPGVALRPLLRQRRSAVALDGATWIDAASFYSILGRTMPVPARVPFASLPWPPRVHLGLFVHRVRGLDPGLYLLARDPQRTPLLRAALQRPFEWRRPEDAPPELPLFRLARADVQGTAELVSCHQRIAGAGCFAAAMLAEFDPVLETVGAWAYPRLHWEAGAVGQVLYLEAEAAGIRATGIGCFFDEPTQQVFGLSSGALRTLYHFTVGGAVEDARLQTRPPYPPPAGPPMLAG